MTISSDTAKSIYNGDGATTQFATQFKFLRNSHVRVLLRDAAGNETEWTEGTEYSLTGAGNDSGGTVTVATDPTDFTPQLGEKLVITRNIPNTQESALPLGGSFPSTTVEQMADIAAMRDQQQQEEIDRSYKVPVTDTDSPLTTVPDKVERAGKYFAWDGAGNPIAVAGTATDADVSDKTVKATGAASARTLADHLATLPDSKISSNWSSQPSSLVTRYSSQLPNAISDFGIDNSGTNDVTAAINAALQTVEGLGGAPILFPPGTYLISNNINLFGSGIGIVGFGKGVTVFKRADNSEAGTNDHLFLVGEGADNAAQDIVLADLTIDGNRANQALFATHNIRVENALGVLIRDIESKNACYYGLHIRGEDAATKRITVRDCYIHDTHRDCLDIKNNGGFNEDIVVDGVVCENPGLGGVANDACFDFRGPLVASNLIAKLTGTRHHGIRIRGLDNGTVEGRPTISNFRIVGNASHTTDDALLIEGIDVKVMNGHVEGCGNNGVQVQATRALVANVEVRNCGAAGFWLRDSSPNIGERARLVNCLAATNGGAGFDIDTDNNSFVSCEARSNSGLGFDIAAGADRNAFVDCEASNNTAGNWSDAGAGNAWHEFRQGTATVTLTSGGGALVEFDSDFSEECLGVWAMIEDDIGTAAESVYLTALTAGSFTLAHRPNPGPVQRTIRYMAWGR